MAIKDNKPVNTLHLLSNKIGQFTRILSVSRRKFLGKLEGHRKFDDNFFPWRQILSIWPRNTLGPCQPLITWNSHKDTIIILGQDIV